jgi:hypothetical protein
MMERTIGVGEDDMEVDSEEDTLHDMIDQMWGHGSETQWHRMEKLLEINPRSARLIRQQTLPLHRALSRHQAQLSTIRALVAAYPQALSERGESGNLPLHSAALTIDTEPSILRTLLYGCEESIQERDEEGRLPLHASCRYIANVSTAWELLSFCPAAAKEKCNQGNTPLDLALRFLMRKISSQQAIELEDIPERLYEYAHNEREFIYCTSELSRPSRIFFETDTAVLVWTVVQLLLMALHHGVVPPVPPTENFEDGTFFPIAMSDVPGVGTKFRALHAAVATGVQQDVVNLTISLYQEQLREQDDDHNRLPLHWACISATHKNYFCFPCNNYKTRTTWYEKDNTPSPTICEDCFATGMRYAVEKKMNGMILLDFSGTGEKTYWDMTCDQMNHYQQKSTESVIERLVEVYPEAAGAMDKHGRLPLHYLSTSPSCFDHPNGLFSLIYANPTAMHLRDPKTGLLPFQSILLTATAMSPATETQQVDLIFRIMLADPGSSLCTLT